MPAIQYPDEISLIKALRGEDSSEAFEIIYRKYWFNMYCWALKQTHSKELSEELVQIVFEKVWRNRQHSDIKNLGAYLAVSLKHTLQNTLRNEESAKKIIRNNLLTDADNTTENDVNIKLLNDSFNKILQELPEKTQAVFYMSRNEKKSAREIARQMKISEKAVEYHISKVLKMLRSGLKEYLNLFL